MVGQTGPIDSPQISQGIAHTISCPPQSDSKTLLLKTSHTYVINHGEIELKLNWKLQPYWSAFTVLEGAIHTTIGERNHHSYITTSPVSYTSSLPIRYAN